MKKTVLILFTLLLAASTVSAQAKKRLPYEINKDKSVACDTIYTLPDTKAEYKGGTSAMFDYFKTNMKQADELVAFNASRRMVIQLLIDDKGKIVQSKVIVPLKDKEYNDEALRVISTMPDFTPAKSNGHDVCSYLVFPLNFK